MVWIVLFILTLDFPWGELLIFGAVLPGLAAPLGYRLFWGARDMKWARWTVRLAIVVGVPLALLLVCFGWIIPTLGPPSTLQETANRLRLAALQLFGDRDGWVLTGALILFALLFSSLGNKPLLRYADPAWYDDPRRLARENGGSAVFNTPPCWPLPPGKELPESFSVDRGKLTVEGDTLTVKTWGKAPRSFPVDSVAGVVLGSASGFNILYDKDRRALARFAWSRKNAVLLGQYLLSKGVPFMDLEGKAVPTQAPQSRDLPQCFTVRESRLCLVLGWIGLLFFGAGLTAALVFWALERDGGLLFLAGVCLLFVLLFGWMLLSYRNRRLEVDGTELVYTTAFGRTTSFRLADVARIHWGVNSSRLTDHQGRVLARFEDNMDNAPLLAVYLNAYQNRKD